ncbi:MAG: hypothetical protein PVI11_05885 [Candidatus Aminicenantes bacterium]|jgi:hypothetical protein
MKSMTIHGLDDKLDKEIRKEAKSQGISLNKTIKRLLTKALGLKPPTEPNYREEFQDLFGVWSEEEYKEFTESMEDFEIVDHREWK